MEFRGERYDSYEDAIIDGTAFLSLFTSEGVKIISLKEISGFKFTDSKINADANRALDLIMQSRDSDTRNLTVKLPGQKSRKVSLSYVIPTPIWKVSYRLDLSKEKPFLQGWAIVDNDSDTDWEQVELALVTGKPVSFIQNLYAPYHLSRPPLPLAIAGIAEANTYDSGNPGKMSKAKGVVNAAAPMYQAPLIERARGQTVAQSEIDSLCMSLSSAETSFDEFDDAESEIFSMSEGLVETALGLQAGDQFEFTIKNPSVLLVSKARCSL